MSTQGHTPGPWTFNEVATSCGRAYRIGSGEMLTAGKGCCIIYDDYGHGENQRYANARLIAAAPDMLAALRLVQATTYQMHAEAVAVVDAAIAKAEGR